MLTKTFSVAPCIYSNGGFYDTEYHLEHLLLSEYLEHVDIIAEVFQGCDIFRRNPRSLVGPSRAHLDYVSRYFSMLNSEVRKLASSVIVHLDRGAIWHNMLFSDGPDGFIPVYEMFRYCDRPTITEDTVNHVNIISKNESLNLEGPCFFLGSAGSSNYGHWLIDDLPRLKGLKEIDGATCIMTSYGDAMNRVRSEGIKIATNEKTMFLNRNKVYKCNDLYFVTPVSVHPRLVNPDALLYLVDALSHSEKVVPKRKLFVNRISANSRHLINSAAVVNLLEKHGYEEIFPEKFTFAQQVTLFRNAKSVVGLMGAAMTNTIFCRDDTKVLYLAPDGWAECFYWNLAAMRNHEYNVIYGERGATDINAKLHPHQSSFSIDLNDLDKWLTEE